jgi:predicted glycosyltransferase
MKAEPARFHDVLAHARFVVSEGASTAAECAMLGVPVMYINPTVHGYCRDLERRGLMAISTTPEPALRQVNDWIDAVDLGEDTRLRRDEMLKEKIDVTSYVVREIDELVGR